MKIRNMKKMTKVVLALAAMGLGGCDLTVPDLNNPGVESIRDNPTRSSVLSATTGLLIGHRGGMGAQNGYVAQLGVLGREGYILDTADPRYVSEMLSGERLDPGSPAFGGNFWAGPYLNIRNAHTVLDATEKVSGVTETEKKAIQGFAKTIQALDFLTLINTRDIEGAPIDVNRKLGDELAPIATKAEVFNHIAMLLDDAKADLLAGGDKFPFKLSAGFVGFEKPASFLKFNRAVRARVAVYMEQWATAQTALDESFLDETITKVEDLDTGVYHVFSGASGDTANGLNSANIYANPALLKNKDGSTREDDRVGRKLTKAEEARKWQGITTDVLFTLYPDNEAPLPIIRNEELLLLRAESYMKQENYAEATRLLDIIRTKSGGLPPLPEVLSDPKLMEDELLEQRRFSLLFEGGHRWIDMRRYNRLEELRQEDPAGVDFKVHHHFPHPVAETDARQ
ncbi:RagB/SusD family nutrient uptake outer membrane protein [Archangium gephyra]|uniref:RagB/SusD family nutrient uptake outer membrane protein n=1 Tax=Archangium gephyra TaxID=48 RepID=UPI0035D4E5FE